MAIYRIADLDIDIQHQHAYTAHICKSYLSPCQEHADMTAKPNPEEYANDRLAVPTATDGYLEALSIYRSISHQLLNFDGFILHAAVVERAGAAYAFAAKSGTGKTTHCRLWLERFPDARIINGDKPLVRLLDGKVYLYGTPWCGKENYQVNTKAPLKGICFLERAAQNTVVPISKSEAVTRIFPQLLIPKDPSSTNRLLDLVGEFIEKTPAYLLKCNMDPQAAQVSYDAMSQSGS
ncbi:MAG: hypothetical protein ACI4RV_06810 [Eubacteriales bacterium]